MTEQQQLVDTWVAEMVEKVGAAAEKAKFVALPGARPAKKDEQKAGDKPEHASDQKPSKAVLEKAPGYAQRGHDFLAANAGGVPRRDVSPGSVYADFSRDYLEKIVDLLRKRTTFPGGPAANFNPGAKSIASRKAGQRFPYTWEAHHMVPASAFYLKDENDRPAFTDEQRDLLMQTPYDVNHGHNIIMLPKLAWGAPVHGLLQHPSDHPEYTKRVIKLLQEIADSVQKKVKQKKPHKDVVANFFELLKKVEDKNWNFLVDLSHSSVAGACAGKTFDHPAAKHVLFAAQTRPTQYQFGRLY